MRYLAVLLLLTLTTSASGLGAYVPMIAASVGSSAVGRETPGPTPPVSDVCENCNGTGKLGDGTVFVTCPECNGTGKKKTMEASGGVNWLTDYATAVEVAEDEGKPLLALFTMPTRCPYCVVLERFHAENVEALQGFVCVRMPTDPETLRTWKVEDYPTQFVVRDGLIKRRWSGLFTQDSGQFGEELRRAKNE